MFMISRFIVTCHVSTIPKSPPKMIREEKLYRHKTGFFYFKSLFMFSLSKERFFSFIVLSIKFLYSSKSVVFTESGITISELNCVSVNPLFTTRKSLYVFTNFVRLGSNSKDCPKKYFMSLGNNSRNFII